MVEHGGLDIMCLNKYRPGSSSPTTPVKEKKIFTKMKDCLTEDYPQKNAEILSGQYGINLLLVGVSLMLAISHHGGTVYEEHLLSFITVLMILQLLWMLWYAVRRDRLRNQKSEKDEHAGTSWLRGGLTLLALLSLIMDAFRIGYYVGYRTCVSAALGVYPVIHALHTITQVHFLWFHIKDVIKTYETFERFGVIHAVFTNLLLWSNGVMSEADHFLNNQKRRLTDTDFYNYTTDYEPRCNCSNSACSIFSSSLYYLYPFNIEYHILVSAMLFVMWKNIGRNLDYLVNQKRPATKSKGLVVGPVLGLVALASTIGVLVVYIIQVDASETRESAISMFYCYGIVMLAFMCAAGVAGLLLYRADSRPLDSSKNPSRQLDTQLLFGASVGSWLVSWCSVVAVAAAPSHRRYRWTNCMYSLLLVMEKYIQNLFIIESLYRKPEPDDKEDAATPTTSSSTPEVFSVASSLAQPYNGIVNHAYDNQDKVCVSLENDQEENGQAFGCVRKVPEGPPTSDPGMAKAANRRRQVLKNISIFLFMCNISLWILPAFGCRPQYDNGLEQETFGATTWTTVLNFAMPMSLFYRMHSVASLFEVFRRA